MPVVRQRAMPSAVKATAAKKQPTKKKKPAPAAAAKKKKSPPLPASSSSSKWGKHKPGQYEFLPPEYRIQPKDIVCGRKAATFANKDSNVFYRELSEECFQGYEAVDTTQKAQVSKAIFSTLKKRGYRFISCDSLLDPNTIEAGYVMSDAKSTEKIR